MTLLNYHATGVKKEDKFSIYFDDIWFSKLDEADYILALAYLADHREQKGLDKIAQIKANPDHT